MEDGGWKSVPHFWKHWDVLMNFSKIDVLVLT